MRIKLIQAGVVDCADNIRSLDFSGLSGQADWAVTVDFGRGDEVIAEVVWMGSAAYSIWTEFRGQRSNYKTVDYHSHIVPVIICRLVELLHLERISDIRRPKPIVRVAPINT